MGANRTVSHGLTNSLVETLGGRYPAPFIHVDLCKPFYVRRRGSGVWLAEFVRKRLSFSVCQCQESSVCHSLCISAG